LAGLTLRREKTSKQPVLDSISLLNEKLSKKSIHRYPLKDDILVGEGGVFVPDRGGGVDVDRCGSSTVRYESVDSYNRLVESQ